MSRTVGNATTCFQSGSKLVDQMILKNQLSNQLRSKVGLWKAVIKLCKLYRYRDVNINIMKMLTKKGRLWIFTSLKLTHVYLWQFYGPEFLIHSPSIDFFFLFFYIHFKDGQIHRRMYEDCRFYCLIVSLNRCLISEQNSHSAHWICFVLNLSMVWKFALNNNRR